MHSCLTDAVAIAICTTLIGKAVLQLPTSKNQEPLWGLQQEMQSMQHNRQQKIRLVLWQSSVLNCVRKAAFHLWWASCWYMSVLNNKKGLKAQYVISALQVQQTMQPVLSWDAVLQDCHKFLIHSVQHAGMWLQPSDLLLWSSHRFLQGKYSLWRLVCG